MKKILKNRKISDRLRYISKNIPLLIKKWFLGLILLGACHILPDGYKENLINNTWLSTETISTSTGPLDINYTMNLSDTGIFDITIAHPVNGTSTETFFYEVGYYEPKYAIVLYDGSDPSIPNPPIIGPPIFFRFENSFNNLVTSSNANMSLPRKWNN